ncbi:MAG: cation transporter [Bacteroidetes bacterium]|nr:cation transporter [Bacteroidota bacterium]
MKTNPGKLINTALWLSVLTIVYNIAEGLVSIFFGLSDDTLALLGFGIDSFVEVISGAGILHMVIRMKRSGEEFHDRFERNALRITGYSFFLLAVGLIFGSIINITQGNNPDTTIPGILISVFSIGTMWFLMRAKLKTGKKLGSEAIIADAMCTRTCFYLSVILLISSGLYEIFRIGYFDIAGSLGIAWFAFREGKEALEKAAGKTSCSCGTDGCH